MVLFGRSRQDGLDIVPWVRTLELASMSVEVMYSVSVDGVMLLPGSTRTKHIRFFSAFLSRQYFLCAAKAD
jgi:hypothetical protein